MRGAEARESSAISDDTIVEVIEAYMEDERGDLSFVPDVIENLMLQYRGTADAWKARLVTLARAGIIELRPESNQYQLTPAAKQLSIAGPQGSLLAWIRVINPKRYAASESSKVDDCGCAPFTVVSKDPEKYAVCKARADRIGKLTTPRAIYDFVSPDMKTLTHEEFYVLGIGAHGELEGKLVAYGRIAAGGQHKVEVEVERMGQILLADRPDIYFIIHNHPAGDSTPSEEDERLTADLRAGLAKSVPKIVFGDHIIVAEKEFYSFREGGKTKIK